MTISASDPTSFADERGAVVLDPKLSSAPGYLGPDGERTLPPTFAQAFGDSTIGGETLLRQMKREPVIRFGDNIIRAIVCEGNHRIVSARPEPDPETMDGAQIAEARKAAAYRDFCVRMIDGLRRPFPRTLHHAMDAFTCGHKLFEAEVAIVAGELRAIDYAPKPRSVYSLRVTRSNILLGAIPNASGTVTASSEMVPASNLFLFSLGGEDDDPRGERALDSAYDAFYRKNVARPVELRALETNAGGISWAEQTDATLPDTIDLKTGEREDGTPIIKTVLRSTEAAKELRYLRSGRLAVLPKGFTLKFFDPQSRGVFSEHYDRCDREMLMALLIAARALLEAQFGSKADSESAGGFLESLRDFLRGQLCSAIASQIFLPFLAANFADFDPRLCPCYEIATVEQKDNSRALHAYNAAFKVLTHEQRRTLQSALNIPAATDEEMDAIVEQLLALQTRGSANSAASGDGGATQFKASRSPQDSLAAELKKRDKTFRALLRRFADGKIDRNDVEAEAEKILKAGHKAAMKLGLKASGTKARKVAEDDLAGTITAELEHLADLLDGIEDESVSAAMAESRGRNYVRRMRGTANAAFHESSPAESTFKWLLGPSEDHCEDCPRLARMTAEEPWTKDEVIALPGEGDTECWNGCQCDLIRDDGAKGFGPIQFDPLGDEEND